MFACAAHLLKYGSVAKCHHTTGGKHNATQISGVDESTAEVSATNLGKADIGKMGTHLHYHTPKEYKALMVEQQAELSEWRKNDPDAKK